MLFRIANSEDPIQKQSDLGLYILEATSVPNFRTFTITEASIGEICIRGAWLFSELY